MSLIPTIGPSQSGTTHLWKTRMIRERTFYSPRLGKLIGGVDLVDDHRICGWALNVDFPEITVSVEILIGDNVIAKTLADRFREDLNRDGVGNGEHGFEVGLPPGLVGTGRLIVRRMTDGMVIPGWHEFASPRTWRRRLGVHRQDFS